MYGHQIKYSDACNNNLDDDGISRLVWNGRFAASIQMLSCV